MTPKEVAFIEKWINNYPKKMLGLQVTQRRLLDG
ncbi:Mobile element protein [Streptococcus pneumoniae]|nr:Mobile element protein [Streptococcus pneumoniae]